MNTRKAMEKGQTASKYVKVWPLEAVNNAGDEAITGDRALLCGVHKGKEARSRMISD